jgi:hypothetical protein
MFALISIYAAADRSDFSRVVPARPLRAAAVAQGNVRWASPVGGLFLSAFDAATESRYGVGMF